LLCNPNLSLWELEKNLKDVIVKTDFILKKIRPREMNKAMNIGIKDLRTKLRHHRIESPRVENYMLMKEEELRLSNDLRVTKVSEISSLKLYQMPDFYTRFEENINGLIRFNVIYRVKYYRAQNGVELGCMKNT
jgi:hypothetical protein